MVCRRVGSAEARALPFGLARRIGKPLGPGCAEGRTSASCNDAVKFCESLHGNIAFLALGSPGGPCGS
jgi:hypothetical protein